MELRKRTMQAALAAVTVTAGVAVSPLSASASGGGCIDYIKNGWNIGVCSSDNGTKLFGDMYVNTRGSLGSTCYIYIELIQVSGNVGKGNRTDGCSSGHHPALSATMTGHTYYTRAKVVVNGVTKVWGESPYTYDD